MTASEVAVVTPWYPSVQRPFLGAFVRAMVEATAPACERMTLFHCDEWPYRRSAGAEARIDQAYRELRTHRRAQPESPAQASPDFGDTGSVVARAYVPVPLPIGLDYASIARRHADALGWALGGQPIEAEVVHAHVGLPGGWAALRNARPDARIFVTEHASFLGPLLDRPEARAMYDELLHRCRGVFAVGESVRGTLVDVFPHHANRVATIPNPISFAAERPLPVTALRRWLFVGNLTEHKGVHVLLEAFARCWTEDARLTLTFVGDGPLRGRLAARVAELGLDHAVAFAGAVEPAEVTRLMMAHDLLVHPSKGETFGMVVVEAVAAGMAVLVTKCGGPEESLAGIERQAGELIDVDVTRDSLAAGYRQLAARFPDGVDLPHARRVLAERFGYERVAEAHRKYWFAGA